MEFLKKYPIIEQLSEFYKFKNKIYPSLDFTKSTYQILIQVTSLIIRKTVLMAVY